LSQGRSGNGLVKTPADPGRLAGGLGFDLRTLVAFTANRALGSKWCVEMGGHMDPQKCREVCEKSAKRLGYSFRSFPDPALRLSLAKLKDLCIRLQVFNILVRVGWKKRNLWFF
jgi:hypothetical protein